jgi:hypothetical protein
VGAVTGTVAGTLKDKDGSCSFEAEIEGTEDRSLPWLCADCDTMFAVQIWSDEGCLAAEQGWVGLDGSGWHFSDGPYRPLQRLGDATVQADQVVGVDVELTLSAAPDDADPMWGMTPPDTYACGYATTERPVYEGGWTYPGGPVADGWFLDACGEPVRLHDVASGYTVIDLSSILCEPCQRMAGDEHTFEAAMAELGVPYTVITLLTPSPSHQTESPPVEDLAAWAQDYNLHGPVLADRGWGYGLVGMGTHLGEGGDPEAFYGLGMPTWMVLSPDLEVLDQSSGYSSWYPIEAAITAHLAASGG